MSEIQRLFRAVRVVRVALLTTSMPMVGTGCGACIEANAGTVEDKSTGPHETNIENPDVTVEHADTQVNAAADVHIDTNIDIHPDFGGDASGASGGTTAVGDGVAFTLDDEGPIDDHADVSPSFSDGVDVDSVEWRVHDVAFDQPTVFDDASTFNWGPADDDGSWLLSARFGDDAKSAFRWDTATAVCVDADCHPRSIAAACSALVDLRVWTKAGDEIVATAEHTSKRPTCHHDG